MLKVLGLRIEKYNDQRVEGHNCDFEYIDDVFEKHILCCIHEDKAYEIEFTNSEGECGSGWTTASWGGLNVLNVKNFKGITHLPTSVLEIHTSILHTDIDHFNNNFIEFSVDGGDSYYPLGGYYIEMKHFKECVNAENDKPVWVIKAEEDILKLYEGDFIDLNIGRYTGETYVNEMVLLTRSNSTNEVKHSLIDFDEKSIRELDFTK